MLLISRAATSTSFLMPSGATHQQLQQLLDEIQTNSSVVSILQTHFSAITCSLESVSSENTVECHHPLVEP